MPSGYYGCSPPLVRDRLLVEPRTVADLDFRSPILAHENGNVIGDPPLVGIPSMYQPFPTSADALLRLLGDGEYPSGWTTDDVLGIYRFDSDGNIVDLTGQQPDLVSYNSPLTLRDLVGLFGDRVGGETQRNSMQRWAHESAGRFAAVPDGATRSYVIIAHGDAGCTSSAPHIMSTQDGAWLWYAGVANGTASGYPPVAEGHMVRVSGGSPRYIQEFGTRAWIALAAVVSSTGPQYKALIRTPTATSVWSGPVSGNAWNDYWFGVPVQRNYPTGALTGARQYAYMFAVAKEITNKQLTNMMRHGALRRDCAYWHDGEIVVRVAERKISGYAKNQAVVGYSSGLVGTDNPGGLGLQCFAQGQRMLGVCGGDIWGQWGSNNSTKALCDGPSGLRDACAVTAHAYGTPPYYGNVVTSRGISALGPSDVPWRADFWLRCSAGTNPWVHLEMLFTGDSGGNESIVAYAGYPPVGGQWTCVGGTVTPSRSGHTTVYLIAHVQDATQPVVQLSDLTLIRNYAAQPLEWCALSYFDDYVRPASLTAGSSSAPWMRYDRGRVEISHVREASASNAALLHLGNDFSAQVLVWYDDSGELHTRIRAASGEAVWVTSVSGLPSGKRLIALEWDALAGYGRLEAWRGAGWETLASYSGGPWTPGVGGGGATIGSVASGTTWPFVGWIERIVAYDRPRRR